MTFVVFLRGVNVGGTKRFSPSLLARELATLDVVNLGAAGTFVVRRGASEASVRKAFVGKLPFEAEMMVCPAKEIIAALDERPFGVEAPTADLKWYVTVMATPPVGPPRLPIQRPDSDAWEVRVLAISGRLAFSAWHRRGKNVLYPNEVIEKTLGIPATTRNWSTLVSVGRILDGGE